MIVPSDEDYQQTKRIKLNGAPLPAPFKELAEWIEDRYDVCVLNIVYDTVIPDNRPRLSVILELEVDARKFRDGKLGNFDQVKQEEVRRQFKRLASECGRRNFNLDGLFVIFNAFEAVARIEANQSVSKDDLKRLQAKLKNNDLWTISNMFDTATFFFYIDTQMHDYVAKGYGELCAEEYGRLVEPWDQFGYLAMRGISVYFDSKENFDKNYHGNWYNYYK